MNKGGNKLVNLKKKKKKNFWAFLHSLITWANMPPSGPGDPTIIISLFSGKAKTAVRVYAYNIQNYIVNY